MGKKIGFFICVCICICTVLFITGCKKKNASVNVSFYVDETLYQTVEVSSGKIKEMPNDPKKTGYEFSGWFYDKDTFENEFLLDSLSDNPIKKNTSIYADFTAIDYTISYKNTKDATNSNPTTYNIETSTITLDNLSKEGYTFDGWYIDSKKVTKISLGSYGNRNLEAKWSLANYTISYSNTKDAPNSNEESYNIETSTITLEDLSKDGYTFEGWFVGDDKVTEITLGSTGNKSLEAKWTPIVYTATFKNGAEVVTTRTFTVEDTVIDDLPAVPDKDYYYGGWENYEIEANDIEINADYTPIDYTISYTNIEGATNSNEESYNIETLTITLKNPTKAGYTFEGWFVGDDEVTEITLGSTGNKSLEAKWTPIVYTATFKNGTEVVTTRTFTIEDTVIDDIPAVPDKNYYYDDWESYEIEANDIEINAIHKPIYYGIFYTNTREATNSNPTYYCIETTTFSLNDLSKEGYTFDGWFVGEDEVTEIAIGSHGIKNLEAKWSLTNYSITYTNTKDATNTNQTEYNVETLTITLTDLIKDGYTFDGWFIGETKVTEIALGSTGDKTIDAKWTPIEYEISYNLDGGLNNSANPTTYNVEDGTIKLKSPTQEGKTFNGWEMNSEFVSSFSSSLAKNINLEAIWIDKVELSYTKDSNNNITITGFVNSDMKSTLRVLDIGETYDGCDVVGIAKEAFEYCSALKILTIPEGVESIGEYAFYGCTNLKYNVSGNVNYLGNDTNPYLVAISVTDKTLTSYTLQNTIKIIYRKCFYGCTNLVSITIPNSVESLGAAAFVSCTSLESVTILGSIKCIEGNTFYGCKKLERITIPGSVERIGDYALFDVVSLSEVNYLGTMEEWFKIEYGLCVPLFYTEPFWDDCNYFLMNGSLVTEIEIPNTVSFIMGSLFESCIALTSVTIPDSVVSIGNEAFAGCKYLRNVYIESDEVANGIIAANSFGNIVEHATTIYIEESITTIGSYIIDNYTTDSTTTINGVTYNIYTK